MNDAREFAEAMLLGLGYEYDLEKILTTTRMQDNPYYQILFSEVERFNLGSLPRWALDDLDELLKKNLRDTPHAFIRNHSWRVRNFALDICPKSIDTEVVELAAILHDIAKPKGEEIHASESAKIAERWLNKNEFPAEIAKKVTLAIATDKKPTIPEAKVLYDASHLDKIGITGIAILLIKAYHNGTSLEELVELWKSSKPNWVQGKHKSIKTSQFHFAKSRELAFKRLRFMDKFFRELEKGI